MGAFPLAALEAASGEVDPDSLAAAQRLRRQHSPEDAAWALTQVSLRRRAAAKLERADEMLFTPAGLEQATRTMVARWRAQRFVDAGVRRVWDVGCGIGSDAMAFADAGIDVVAIDADPDTVEIATWNLALVGAGPARLGLAEELTIPDGDAVFLDPARRTARGRTWNVEHFTPPWALVMDYVASQRFVCVKLGPGVPKEILPAQVQCCWVSDRGDVCEASLWNHATGHVAVRMESPVAELGSSGAQLPVAAVGRFVAEPDGAAIRAGLVAESADGAPAWLLDAHVAYLSSDQPLTSPWLTCFEVDAVLPFDRKTLARYVREHAIGTLEIKQRALDVDPAALRRQLKPKGPNQATIILARTVDGARAIVAHRC
uniref:class I SAM-dependent methyltransferase n=1 Tax=Tessaracoccus timonensis TaxID=2161816 RepID=UPI000D54E8E9|nr:methyltransferase domain-containing protein [Tessaracoccus timonensis]